MRTIPIESLFNLSNPIDVNILEMFYEGELSIGIVILKKPL